MFDRLQMELADLKAQLDARQRALFSPTSEKQKRHPKSKQKTPQTGHGPTPQPELPIVEEIHTLDDADQTCPVCGDALAEMDGQFEESEEVDIIERTYRIVRHKRQKYRCTGKGCVDTALGPSKLVVGCRYSIDPKYAGMVRMKQGKKAAARRYLETYLRKRPNAADAGAVRDLLSGL